MLYHGIDMVEVARVRRAIQRWGPRFLERVFTQGELADCGVSEGAPRFESLAARWAAKEAFAKAVGIGLSGLGSGGEGGLLRLRAIEVARGPRGRPELRLHAEAAEALTRLRITELALSLSHTADHAIASVVGVGSPEA